MIYSYVGLIKKNSHVSKVLVVSEEGRYFVWTTNNSSGGNFLLREGMNIPSNELVLADQRQINAGRGELWVPNSSRVLCAMVFHGVVSGGKTSKTILVKHLDTNPHFFIYRVPSGVALALSVGDIVQVDTRNMSIARQDQIEAGLGNGRLRRKRRSIFVS